MRSRSYCRQRTENVLTTITTALLHRHALTLDRLLTFLVALSILILKLSFSQSLSLHGCLSFPQADLLEL